IKQALPKLKVQADWRAPVARNHSEAEWLRVARGIVAEAVPQVLYEDEAGGWFVMEYLPPEHYPVWKSLLRDGMIEPGVAATVGRQLARIHAATAGRDDIAERFATDHIFFPIRAEPYLIAPIALHPDLKRPLNALADRLMRTTLALVHGDVSPKNILIGPNGPVLLDAECAWYGDPAFDVAFVLNHLLLKCVWRPQWAARYMECFDALSASYGARIDWESASQCEARAAQLLPGLLLGRVDGKSPAEYVTAMADKAFLRDVARELLLQPVSTLREVAQTWTRAFAARRPEHRSCA
ncbi:MAG: phosphotransferase, partial [Betaproteobacteria bacterium]